MEKENEHKDIVLNRQANGLPTTERVRSVFSLATPLDLAIIAVSCVAAIVAGGLNPLLTVLYGQLVESFNNFQNGTIPGSALRSDISKFTLYFVYLAIGMFVSIYITTVGFYYTGERITKRLRGTYLKSIIGQNMAFFDTLGTGDITSRITSEISVIQEAITGNLSISLTAAATFVSAFVIAFVEYWKLALILTSTVIVLTLTGTLGVAYSVKWTKQSLASYGSGATIAEEAISSIKHVTAFGIQETFIQRYDSHLQQAERPGFKAGIATALMVGAMNAIPFLSYGLSFWEGSRLLINGEMSVSGVTTSTLAIVIGAWAVGRVAPNAKAFIGSIASATVILDAIARRSTQDPFSEKGISLPRADLDITFRDTQLIYPSRREVTVLKGLNLVIPALKTTAIVGPSGCGKSSIVALLERFYEPTNGEIWNEVLGEHNIDTLNLNWLRSQMALVEQEPMLFNTTVFENILYGLGDKANSLPIAHLEELVEDAAKTANAHDFISRFPLGYQTKVGEKGAQLSGGQKQRICIARAIIKKPPILLLDEATSALDVEAEQVVQNALSAASKERTTIVIAHRLSTIRNADNIVVMAGGEIVEQGTHADLLASNGRYAELVTRQQISTRPIKEKGLTDIDDRSIGTHVTTVLEAQESDETKVSLEKQDNSHIISPGPSAKISVFGTLRLIAIFSKPERGVVILAISMAILAGLTVPAQSIIFAKLINALSLTQAHLLRERVDFWSLMYLAIGCGALIIWLGQGMGFAYATEKQTHRVRREAFRHILRQDVGFFDLEQSSAGHLTSLLSSGPTGLNGLSGSVIGALLSFLATILGGIILSLIIGWKFALVCTATIPFVAGFGWLRLAMLSLFTEKINKTHQDSAAYAGEAISAIRTVASMTLETRVLENYNKILSRQSRRSINSILQASVLYAASQSVTFLCAALAFWYGGTLLSTHEYSVLQFFICFAALISGSQTAGVVFSYAPGMSKAIGAAQELKSLFDRSPKIDIWSTAGDQISKGKCVGEIELRNVSYTYPSREDRMVINDLSMTILPGQYVALVGRSGCGKSTIIGLLERFFDPTSGRILIDKQDISELDVNNYRSLISLVGQDPALYSGTIRENLMLGCDSNVSEEDIMQACREANIYDLINSLPNGLSTDLGTKGSMLSGGQKQRLAIARALLRNTKILLLDEATAALDSESEKVVQEALDRVSKSRTTIAIAHRLSTIQHADVIYVLNEGCIVESGNHSELMAKKGTYAGLVELQKLGTSDRDAFEI